MVPVAAGSPSFAALPAGWRSVPMPVVVLLNAVWQFAHHSDMPEPYAARVCAADSVRLYAEGTTAFGTWFANAPALYDFGAKPLPPRMRNAPTASVAVGSALLAYEPLRAIGAPVVAKMSAVEASVAVRRHLPC